MSFSTPCPEPARLKDLVNGSVTGNEQTALTSHLESCERCQQKLEELVAGRELWSDARNLGEPHANPDAALQRVICGLKGQAHDATQDTPALEDEVPLNFLSHSEKLGSLGRLGPYEIMQVIGRGGMGVVLKALDPSLQRIVAIKVLAPHLATNGTARRRFTREAQAAAAVTHDHVVTIHAVDEANGFPYLVMQFIDGMSLQDRIDKSGPLELKEILRIGMQAASGLAAAHAQGLIHRDIKPANILLENGVQRVKITDFGLARAADDAAGLTQSGVVTGTPQYMAPEQARGEALDHRADLFSIGSVLYTMCTGRAPFRATTPLAVLRRVSDDAPRPIKEINPEIPDWLTAVIAKLHAKNPADRIQSAREVADLLGQQLAQLQQAAWTPPPSPLAALRSPELIESVERVSEPAQPLTTVAICPACACQLHIPSSLAGHTMKCPKCGKVFHVEDSALDNKAVQKPPRRKPAPAATKQKSMAWVVFLIVGVVVLPACCLGIPVVGAIFYFIPEHAPDQRWPDGVAAIMERSEMSSAQGMGSTPAAMSGQFDALSWFPMDATLCGFIDFRKFTPLTLDGDFGQTLRAKVPPDLAAKLTQVNLGKIRIDRIAFAYADDRKVPKNARLFVRVTGQMDHKRVVEFFRKELPDARVREQKGSRGESVTIIDKEPKAPPIALVGDTDLIFAWYLEPRDKENQQKDEPVLIRQMFHVKAKTEPHYRPSDGTSFEEPSIFEGGLFGGLNRVPADACGLLLGELPPEVRAGLAGSEPPAPNLIELRLRPGSPVTLSADVLFDNAKESKAFGVAMERWHDDGVGALLQLAPGIKLAPEATAALRKTLGNMHNDATVVGASGQPEPWIGGRPVTPGNGIHRIQMDLSQEALAALWEIVKQLPWSGSGVKVAKPVSKRFEGTWQTTELHEDGVKRPPEKFNADAWVFEGNKYKFTHEVLLQAGEFTLDPSKDPKRIDLAVTDNAAKGFRYIGIYKFVGDDLVLCFASGELVAGAVHERPTEFSAGAGTGRTLYVLKRKKD
jgi:uncharacterized protein (TIGR03067 family)